MAKAAERGGVWLPRSLLLLALLPLPAAARPPASFPSDVNGHSLHPPYFNLAEGTRISATATCGEEAAGAGSRRAVEDLYCKLVGGPVAGGDPNQTIQVRPGRGGRAGRAPSPLCVRPSRCGAGRAGPRSPRCSHASPGGAGPAAAGGSVPGLRERWSRGIPRDGGTHVLGVSPSLAGSRSHGTRLAGLSGLSF